MNFTKEELELIEKALEQTILYSIYSTEEEDEKMRDLRSRILEELRK